MKKYILIALIALCTSLPIMAQSNAVIDKILSHPQLLYGDLAYLALSSANIEDIPEEEIQYIDLFTKTFKGFDASRSRTSTVDLGEFCHAMMQAYKIPSGLWYSIFPSSRYALREFLFHGFIAQPAWPSKTVSGDQALRIIGKILDWKERT